MKKRLLLVALGCLSIAQVYAQETSPAPPAPAPASCPAGTALPSSADHGSSAYQFFNRQIRALAVAHRTILAGEAAQKQRETQPPEKAMLLLFSSLSSNTQSYRCAASLIEPFRPANDAETADRTTLLSVYNTMAQTSDDLRLFTAKTLRAAESNTPLDNTHALGDITRRREKATEDLRHAVASSLSNAHAGGGAWSFSAAERRILLEQLTHFTPPKQGADDFYKAALLIRAAIRSNVKCTPG